MNFLKIASSVIIALIIGLSLLAHMIIRPGAVEDKSLLSANGRQLFRSNSSKLLQLGYYQHRPPAHPLNSDWSRASSNRAIAAELGCFNQSACVSPVIQVKKPFSIYLCDKVGRHGARFYFLLSDGLAKHPAVRLVKDIDAADLVLFLPASSPWHRSECTNTSLADRLIVLDEFDGSSAFSPRKTYEELKRDYADKIIDSKNVMWYFMYFKRSYVHRKDGRFIRYPFLLKKDFFPMVYSIADSYVRPEHKKDRSLLLVCTLRGDPKWQPSRLRVLEWIHEYVDIHQLPPYKIVTSQINKASRQTLDSTYFDTMYNAEVVVTANPADWEGDFRLWEALASGALVLVDELSTPMPYPLVHGENVVYYTTQNKSDFLEKLDYYLNHEEERKKIAQRGYMHALRYHRTVNTVDYILRSAHVKLLQQTQADRMSELNQKILMDTRKNQDKSHFVCGQTYSECGQQLVYNIKKKTRLL